MVDQLNVCKVGYLAKNIVWPNWLFDKVVFGQPNCLAKLVFWQGWMFGQLACLARKVVWPSLLYGQGSCLAKLVVWHNWLFGKVFSCKVDYSAKLVVWQVRLFGVVASLARLVVWQSWFPGQVKTCQKKEGAGVWAVNLEWRKWALSSAISDIPVTKVLRQKKSITNIFIREELWKAIGLRICNFGSKMESNWPME